MEESKCQSSRLELVGAAKVANAESEGGDDDVAARTCLDAYKIEEIVKQKRTQNKCRESVEK